jgi:hypothetical protein
MARSYNGWYASPTLKRRIIEPVPGCRLVIVDNNDVATVFDYLVKQFHKRVDDVTKPHPADDWGFNYRPNANNPNQLSCHASGTAIDLDATEHPNKVATSRTFTPKQIAEVHEILNECSRAIRWGGDYTQTADAMHFEVIVGSAVLAAAARKIKALIAAPRKTINQIAKEVIAGKWGNGPTRIVRLRRAGYSYLRVMAEVRRLLGVKPAPPRKTVHQIALEVIAGKWSNGPTRTRKLRAAGYDPVAVQREVNRLL